MKKIIPGILVVGACAGAFFAYRHFRGPGAANKAYSVEHDRELIAKLEPNPETTAALMRLAMRRDPDAKAKALALIAAAPDANAAPDAKRLRLTALQMLGFFDEHDVNLKLKEMLADKDPAVQRTALQAIAMRAPPVGPPTQPFISERPALLRDFLKDKGDAWVSTTPEALRAVASLYSLSQDASEKENCFKQIFSVAHGDEKNPLRSMAFVELLRLAPRDQRVIALAKDVANDTKIPKSISELARRHVAQAQAPAATAKPAGH